MDSRKIDLIAVGIIIVIFLLVYFVFFKESRAQAAVLQEKEAELTEYLNSADDMNPELDRMKGAINDIRRHLEDFDRQLPEEKRMYDFLTEIDTLAKKNTIHLTGISPGNLEKKTLYSRVPVNISGNAGFGAFYRFLFQLENIPRITRTERLQVTQLSHDKGCDFEMDLAVFVGGN